MRRETFEALAAMGCAASQVHSEAPAAAASAGAAKATQLVGVPTGGGHQGRGHQHVTSFTSSSTSQYSSAFLLMYLLIPRVGRTFTYGSVGLPWIRNNELLKKWWFVSLDL